MNKNLLWHLTKDWISYLKRLGYVELESDPNTGRLQYRKQPTVQTVFEYLTNTANFDEEQIAAAIGKVLSSGGSAQQSQSQARIGTNNQSAKSSPAQQPNKQQSPKQPQGRIGANPPAPRLGHSAPQDVNEAFVDDPGKNLSETEVEQIFSILASGPPAQGVNAPPDAQPKQSDNSQKSNPNRDKEINTIKKLLTNRFSDETVLALWRELKNA